MGPNAVFCRAVVFAVIAWAPAARAAITVGTSYIGGSRIDAATSIAVDSAGYIYVAGWTESTDLPAANANQPRCLVPLGVRDDVANLAKRAFVRACDKDVWRTQHEPFNYADDLRTGFAAAKHDFRKS